MRRIEWDALDAAGRAEALARPARRSGREVRDVVEATFDAVRARGWEAVSELAQKFDKVAPDVIAVNDKTVAAARAELDAADLQALETARDNIAAFHARTRPAETAVEVAPGVTCRRAWRPIGCAGLYVPGGTAPLFSSLLMLALPARAAGVETIVATTPPGANPLARTLMTVAADLCGLGEVHVLGGAQAIAAMALGAGPMPKVDKIFGPGGAFVAAAKTYAAGLPGGPAIDLPAGPSELLVIADETADSGVVAADLLSQAEHDADAQVILVVTDAAVADAVEGALGQQLSTLPRADIARASLEHARVVVTSGLDGAIEAANAYAPEHLSLNLADAAAVVDRITNAGAVFVGRWSAETFGDYVCGPSHVLPTDGAARAFGGVTTESFMRPMSVQELTRAGAASLADAAARLARLEGLEAHARAADARLSAETRE